MTQPTARPDVLPTSPSLPLAALPDIPPEVRRFAEAVGIAAYLPAVLAMTRRVYPRGRLTVSLVEDAETENDWQIVIEADVTGWAVDEMVAAERRWSAELFENCPSTHTYYVCCVPWVVE